MVGFREEFHCCDSHFSFFYQIALSKFHLGSPYVKQVAVLLCCEQAQESPMCESASGTEVVVLMELIGKYSVFFSKRVRCTPWGSTCYWLIFWDVSVPHSRISDGCKKKISCHILSLIITYFYLDTRPSRPEFDS